MMVSAVLMTWARSRRVPLAIVATCAVALWAGLAAAPARADSTTVTLTAATAADGTTVLTATIAGTTVPDGAKVIFGYTDVRGAIEEFDNLAAGTTTVSSDALTLSPGPVQALYFTSSATGLHTTSNTVTLSGPPPPVVPTASVTTLSATGTVAAGDAVTLTATVTAVGSAHVPTGKVQFWDSSDGGATWGTLDDPVALDPTGVATLSQGGFAGGTAWEFQARYGGDAATSPSRSLVAATTFSLAPQNVRTVTTAYADPATIGAGGTTTLHAHVEQTGDIRLSSTTGKVTFTNRTTGGWIQDATLDASGDASIEVGGWGADAGTFTILATYAGSIGADGKPGLDPSTAVFTVSVTASSTPPPVTVTAPSPTVVYGAPLPDLTPSYSPAAVVWAIPPTCSTTAHAGSAPGTYGVTCRGGANQTYAPQYVAGTLTIVPATLTVTPPNATMTAGGPPPSLTATVSGLVNGDTAASAYSGDPLCAPAAGADLTKPGTVDIVCSQGTLASTNYTFDLSRHGTLTVQPATKPTALSGVTSGLLRADQPIVLSASLTADGSPVARPVTLTLTVGATSKSCTTAATATSCTLTWTGPLGPGTVSASFVGDGHPYLSSTASAHVLLYAFAQGSGTFVVGDRSATGSVLFWGAQWAKQNALTHGAPPSSFKGWASSVSPTGWTTGPGNSSDAPGGPLPTYLGVIVSSSIGKSGATISGDVVRIVVVRTNPGYDDNPGHAGTGTVVASS